MTASDSTPDDIFDVDRIRRLVELMEQHDLREIDLQQSEQRIRLARGGPAVAPMMVAPSAAPTAAAASTAQAPAAADPDHLITINSPMVGTFYSRPNPKAESFVKVGDMVEPETTVCIIEAMKVFNEIPAEIRGKVVAVLVDDEESVEFGKPLFKVDTSQRG